MADPVQPINNSEFNINDPAVPRYAYQRYPKVLYHSDPKKGLAGTFGDVPQSHILVQNKEEEDKARKKGFTDVPKVQGTGVEPEVVEAEAPDKTAKEPKPAAAPAPTSAAQARSAAKVVAEGGKKPE